MDEETKAEFKKLAQLIDDYEFDPDSGGGLERSSWTTNSYIKGDDGRSFGTEIHTTKATGSPRVVILAGQHGIEPAGWKTAERILEKDLKKGYLKVIPRADPTAIEKGKYSGDRGNMNAQWGTGGEPATEQVANLWNEVTTHNPDFIFDLHSSHGIYSNGSGVGQCVFPTPDARDLAKNVTSDVNDRLNLSGDMAFSVGNSQTGSNNKFSHKVGGDLDAECFLIEPTRRGTVLEERIDMTQAIIEETLYEIGLNFENPEFL